MKILVSDFDKTLFTKDILKNVKLVNEFVDKGNIFVIATGRPFYLLKPELDKYKIKYNFLICNDGAVIFNKKNRVIDKTNIDYLTAVQIYNILRRSNDIEHVYIDAIYDFGELDAKDFNGILALPYDHDAVENILNEIKYKYPTVQAYMSHRWLNVLSIEASKGQAIKYLEARYNWNEKDIYTIGDNLNDLSMTIYKNSYAISGGHEEFVSNCKHTVNKFEEVIEKINSK